MMLFVIFKVDSIDLVVGEGGRDLQQKSPMLQMIEYVLRRPVAWQPIKPWYG